MTTRLTLSDYDMYCAIVSALVRLGYRTQYEVSEPDKGRTELTRRIDGKRAEVTWEVDRE